MADVLTPDRAPALDRLRDPRLFREFAYIDGAWRAATSGRVVEVTEPASGARLGQAPALDGSESLRAARAADAAFPAWAGLLPQDRAARLMRWHQFIVDNAEDLAILMTLEQGKPLSEARGEIGYGASFVAFFAEEAKRPDIMGVTSHLPDAEVEVWLEPLGVAALVTPWNFPMAMITRKAAAAMAAGCTVVIHPSGETPFSALALAELADRAGIPAGVFNVVTGDPAEVVGPWTEEPCVRALSFTGSTEVGRLLYGQCAGTIKRLSLELGGHAPFIVFADADQDRAIREAMAAKFATSGQDCLAANRIFVERPVYEAFCAGFTAQTQALRVGDGLSDPEIGPLMNANALAKQAEHVADALERGARLLCGGAALPDLGDTFFAPTVLADVPADARILHEETFGPVAAIAPFDTEDEVLTRANATEYGLMAYLHTRDPSRIYRMSRGLRFGMVGVNRAKITGAPIPFGGMKQSGLGREGSRSGLAAFADVKYVCRDWS